MKKLAFFFFLAACTVEPGTSSVNQASSDICGFPGNCNPNNPNGDNPYCTDVCIAYAISDWGYCPGYNSLDYNYCLKNPNVAGRCSNGNPISNKTCQAGLVAVHPDPETPVQ